MRQPFKSMLIAGILGGAAGFAFVWILKSRRPSYDHTSTLAIALIYAAGGAAVGAIVGGVVGVFIKGSRL